MKRVRTRFAPSPTGSVHIGSIQKVAYSYACARHFDGDYIVRIEDTDQTRLVATAEEEIFHVHELLGIDIDESPKHGGDNGPYRQSERLELYKQHVEQLLEAGQAYYAFETPEELAQMRQIQQAAGERTRYTGQYRDYPLAEAKQRVEAGEKYVVRIKVPHERTITYTDIIMGELSFKGIDVDDYVLMKSDGFPTYHLANVVDDHLMGISHVFRGVEWIATSPVHILLYEFFGWEAPTIAHIPNILDPKGGKLSKRSGSVAVMDFFREGYLPEAIINFIVLLGWSPKNDKEIFSLAEFVAMFDVAKFNKANPVFDRVKLNWFNEQYLRSLGPEDFTKRYLDWEKNFSEDRIGSELETQLGREGLKAALALEQERITLLRDLPEKLRLFMPLPQEFKFDFSHKHLKKLAPDALAAILTQYRDQLVRQNPGKLAWDHATWEETVRTIVTELGAKAGEVFMTLRIVLTGSPTSPPLFEFAEVIGKDEQLARIEKALTQLAS